MSKLSLREVRRQCERFTARLIAEGAEPSELAGLLLGAMMRVMRDRGVSYELYMEACKLLWNNNNAPNVPVDQDLG